MKKTMSQKVGTRQFSSMTWIKIESSGKSLAPSSLSKLRVKKPYTYSRTSFGKKSTSQTTKWWESQTISSLSTKVTIPKSKHALMMFFKLWTIQNRQKKWAKGRKLLQGCLHWSTTSWNMELIKTSRSLKKPKWLRPSSTMMKNDWLYFTMVLAHIHFSWSRACHC